MKLIELLKEHLINNPLESSAPIYQPIYFEELNDIKTSLNRDEFYKKYNLIFNHIEKDLSNKNIIDIGSNAGFYSFAAAERKAIVDALEPLSHYSELCSKLCDIYGIQNINFLNIPVSIEFLNDKNYDYGFMLSVFQWISEGNEKLDYAKDLLMESSKHIDILFFELSCNSGKSAVKTKKINHLAVVYSLLRDNTVYSNIKLIGTTRLWGKRSYRYLFRCSKKDIEVNEPFYSFLKYINI